MTKRIFRSISIVSIAVLALMIALFMSVLYNYFSDLQMAQLKAETHMAARGIALSDIEYLNGLDTNGYRVTFISDDGTVLYDNKEDTSKMENHMEREEIKSAFETGSGESKRYSDTIFERSLYYAEKLPDGRVIRMSVAQSTVATLLLGMAQPICAIIAVVIILSIVLATRVSKSIVDPLNSLNLEEPLENEGYDELSPLLRRLDYQQKELGRQEAKLEKRKEEFTAIVDGMNEGTILIGINEEVFAVNEAAKRILQIEDNPVGHGILYCSRNPELRKVIDISKNGQHGEIETDFFGRKYQINTSPISHDGNVTGIAILLFDITEKEMNEQMRREFTANVSHELKTPLHSITGHAELMANGMVKPDDYAEFSKKIYVESQRMVKLVEDIINLSHLDEGASDMTRESVDLYSLAKDVVESLSDEASAAGVTLTLSGDPATSADGATTLNGVPQLLEGIIYNLCDNAIKYNRRDGHVFVSVENNADTVVLSVEDNGIGIPIEHQNRIFERFYRVDKSHSKEVGGTGLGLSIVKHAAKVHGAELDVSSVPEKGTTITVTFPKVQ